MSRKKIVICFFCLFFVVSKVSAAEITFLDSKVAVQDDGRLMVEEAITFDVGEKDGNFVERILPAYSGSWWRRFDIVGRIAVSDAKGNPAEYSIINEGRSKKIVIKTGGEKSPRYYLAYQVKRTMKFEGNRAMLDWQAVGRSAWPLKSAKVAVIFPKLADAGSLEYGCEVSGSRCLYDRLEFATTTLASQAIFVQENIPPGQALDLHFKFPYGWMEEPGALRIIFAMISEWWTALATIIAVGAILSVIYKKNKNKA